MPCFVRLSAPFAVVSATIMLAACSPSNAPSSGGTAPTATAQAAPAPLDATPVTGQWCGSGERFTISESRFDTAQNQCALSRLNNFQGTFTATIACEATTTPESLTMTPVRGTELHVTYLNRPGQQTVLTRC
jgi:hypothetical protein